mgnify:CR=1 FL=1
MKQWMRDARVQIAVVERFSAAHHLPGHPKCGKVHGHNYRVMVKLRAHISELGENGMLADFGKVKKTLRKVLVKYDHSDLNERIEVPTVENLAIRLLVEMRHYFPQVYAIKIWETEDSWCEVSLPG